MERLSGLDATFLYFETSQQHMHVSMVAVLDPKDMPGGYSFAKVQDLIASRLYQVTASDPWILGAATLVVAVIAIGATVIPAFRSSRLDPVNVLRPE